MWNKIGTMSNIGVRLAAAAALCAVGAWAQSAGKIDAGRVDFGKDSPVTMVSVDWGQSSGSVRGTAYVLDIHATLSLRNAAQRRLRGISLAVVAQEATAGGKGSISVPSLDVAPNETFSVKIDLPLLRPLGAQGGPEVRLDGLLFDDLSFYGPDKLNSRRSMTLWELEARRDRGYFRALLDNGGMDGLQRAVLASISREADRPQPGVQMVRGRSTNVVPESEREMTLAFLQVPDSPVEAKDGVSRIADNEARAPRFELKNRSAKQVKYVDLGWVVRDAKGREFLAATVPADLTLGPGQSAPVVQDAALRFPAGAAPQGMSGFVAHVEFADGSYWIPSRAALDDPKLRALVPPSPEEQRLIQIYRKKGPAALAEELKKF